MPTFDTPGPLTIEVHNRAGDVRVDLADTATTTVDIAASGDLPLPWLQEIWGTFGAPGRRPFDAPAIDRAVVDLTPGSDSGAPADRLYVDTRPAATGWHNRVSVHITAPRGSELRVDGQANQVRVTGTVGPLTVRGASGDISADECAGDVQVATASGDIVLGSLARNLEVRTVSGDLRVRSVAGRAVVQTTSGAVRLGPVGADLAVRTVSGTVTVAETQRGTTRIGTVSGDVDLAPARGVVASVGLSSASGEIRSDLPIEQAPAPAGDAAPRSPGRADVDIRVRTVSGDIRLRRAGGAGPADGETS